MVLVFLLNLSILIFHIFGFEVVFSVHLEVPILELMKITELLTQSFILLMRTFTKMGLR